MIPSRFDRVCGAPGWRSRRAGRIPNRGGSHPLAAYSDPWSPWRSPKPRQSLRWSRRRPPRHGARCPEFSPSEKPSLRADAARVAADRPAGHRVALSPGWSRAALASVDSRVRSGTPPRPPSLAEPQRSADRARLARPAGVWRLESFSADSARMSAGRKRSMSNRTPAATSGPARQPRPASSAPATNLTPSERSWRKSLGPGGRRFTGLPPGQDRLPGSPTCPSAVPRRNRSDTGPGGQ